MYSSRMIGEMYFVANEKCYKKAHPILECEDYVHLWVEGFRKGLSSLIKSFFILKLVDEPVHQIPSGCDETKDLPVLWPAVLQYAWPVAEHGQECLQFQEFDLQIG